MKLALRILVTALIAVLLAVPAASAKSGGGHGQGAEKAKAAQEHKAGKEKKAKKDKSAKKAGKAEKAKKDGKDAEAASEACDEAPSAAAAAVGSLFGSEAESASASACESEDEEAELSVEAPDLEGLGPGQYCHQLEAWMAASGGDFSQAFGTEQSGYNNAHGKCASRRAHGEDLAAAVAEQEEQAEDEAQELALPNLEGLGPGQYCHTLEAWMAANGGNFSQAFGTEGSGYANDHGKCASRRAHGEDLAPAALQSVCDAAKAAGGELPEACQSAEEQQAQQGAPAAAELTAVLRLLSF